MSRMLGQDPLRDAQGPRLSLPFLPTLVTAVLIGAGSLLCRGPATPPPAPRLDAQAFAPAAASRRSADPCCAPAGRPDLRRALPVTAGRPWSRRSRRARRPRRASPPRPCAARWLRPRPAAGGGRRPRGRTRPEPVPVAISQPWLVPPAAIPMSRPRRRACPALALPFARRPTPSGRRSATAPPRSEGRSRFLSIGCAERIGEPAPRAPGPSPDAWTEAHGDLRPARTRSVRVPNRRSGSRRFAASAVRAPDRLPPTLQASGTGTALTGRGARRSRRATHPHPRSPRPRSGSAPAPN